jgi:hypothetical protein
LLKHRKKLLKIGRSAYHLLIEDRHPLFRVLGEQFFPVRLVILGVSLETL